MSADAIKLGGKNVSLRSMTKVFENHLQRPNWRRMRSREFQLSLFISLDSPMECHF